jgi:AcrR family transcriptional regulator
MPEHSPEPRRRGRPVSVAARNAVLLAAAELLDERGLPGFSVDEIARRSRISKSTIYKHWPDGLHIAVEAYGARITETIPVQFTGDPVADLIGQVRRVAEIYAGPRGRVIAQLLGAGAAVDGGGALVRNGFFAQRRSESAQLIRQAVEAGLWHFDFDPDQVIELIFGPIVFRALNGGEPFSPDTAAQLATVALRGLSTPPTK